MVLWSFREAIEQRHTKPRDLEYQIYCVQNASSGIANDGFLGWFWNVKPEVISGVQAGLGLLNAERSITALNEALQIFPGGRVPDYGDGWTYGEFIDRASNDPALKQKLWDLDFGNEPHGHITELAVQYIQRNIDYFRVAKSVAKSSPPPPGIPPPRPGQPPPFSQA